MGKRCTKVDKAQRIAQLVRLISNGAVTSELVQFASTQWQVSRRQADNYIAEAREIIINDINFDRKTVVAEMMAVCRTIIKKGMQSGHYNAVLGAINAIDRMGALSPKQ